MNEKIIKGQDETLNKQIEYIYNKLRENEIVGLEFRPSQRYNDGTDITVMAIPPGTSEEAEPPMFVVVFEGVRDVMVGTTEKDLPKADPMQAQLPFPVIGKRGEA